MANTQSASESRALELLGMGHSPAVVASALGVTEGRISQMLSDAEFAAEVKKRRYENLKRSSEIDSQYDNVEDQLLQKLQKTLPLITKPRDILSAINVVNGAKRRGQQAPSEQSVSQKVVNLNLPVSIQQTFVTSGNNQITEIRDAETDKSHTLVTATSRSLDRFVAEHASQKQLKHNDSEVIQEGSGEGSEGEGKTSLADLL